MKANVPYQDWGIMMVDALGRIISPAIDKTNDEDIHFSIREINTTGWVWIVLQKNKIGVDARRVWINP